MARLVVVFASGLLCTKDALAATATVRSHVVGETKAVTRGQVTATVAPDGSAIFGSSSATITRSSGSAVLPDGGTMTLRNVAGKDEGNVMRDNILSEHATVPGRNEKERVGEAYLTYTEGTAVLPDGSTMTLRNLAGKDEGNVMRENMLSERATIPERNEKHEAPVPRNENGSHPVKQVALVESSNFFASASHRGCTPCCGSAAAAAAAAALLQENSTNSASRRRKWGCRTCCGQRSSLAEVDVDRANGNTGATRRRKWGSCIPCCSSSAAALAESNNTASRRRKWGFGGGCGCCSSSPPPPSPVPPPIPIPVPVPVPLANIPDYTPHYPPYPPCPAPIGQPPVVTQPMPVGVHPENGGVARMYKSLVEAGTDLNADTEKDQASADAGRRRKWRGGRRRPWTSTSPRRRRAPTRRRRRRNAPSARVSARTIPVPVPEPVPSPCTPVMMPPITPEAIGSMPARDLMA